METFTTTLNIRDFRATLSTSLDKVDAGERVMVRRGRRTYLLVPVQDDELTITPALQAKINEARQEAAQGGGILLENEEAINRYFDSLIS